MALKIPKPNINITLKQLIDVVRSKDLSLSRTPFGAAPGEEQWYVKKAVPWKGLEKEEIKSLGGTVKKGKNKGKNLGEVMYNTITKLADYSRFVSKKELGDIVKGVVLVRYRGKEYVMPQKAYLMAKLSGKPIKVLTPLPTKSSVERVPINNLLNVAKENVEKLMNIEA